MSDDDISREDIDWMNHLMRERRVAIQEEGRDSDHFKKIDKDGLVPHTFPPLNKKTQNFRTGDSKNLHFPYW